MYCLSSMMSRLGMNKLQYLYFCGAKESPHRDHLSVLLSAYPGICLSLLLLAPHAFHRTLVDYLSIDLPLCQSHCLYNRITGIFCGCLIFAEFCRSIEIAEIKNRKIFQSPYNDEIVSEVIIQSRIFRCLSGIVVELPV